MEMLGLCVSRFVLIMTPICYMLVEISIYSSEMTCKFHKTELD